MSINSMTNDELKRSFAANPEASRAVQNNQLTDTLHKLVTYIPLESITLYLAAVSTAQGLSEFFPFMDAKVIYWLFGLVITPLLILLVYLKKQQAANMPNLTVADYPWWRMFAGTIAFLVWALAIPGNPYVSSGPQAAATGFLALFISMFLSLVEPLVPGRSSQQIPAQ